MMSLNERYNDGMLRKTRYFQFFSILHRLSLAIYDAKIRSMTYVHKLNAIVVVNN